MNKDSFQPQTAFEGYVKASLDNMEKRLDSLPCGETFKRLGKCETDIANIEGRATVFGVVAGFVAGIFAKIFIK